MSDAAPHPPRYGTLSCLGGEHYSYLFTATEAHHSKELPQDHTERCRQTELTACGSMGLPGWMEEPVDHESNWFSLGRGLMSLPGQGLPSFRDRQYRAQSLELFPLPHRVYSGVCKICLSPWRFLTKQDQEGISRN